MPSAEPSSGMFKVTGLRRIYHLGGQEIRALDGLDLRVEQGEFLRIVGSSGSGKSTLLNLLAGLDTATAGEVETPDGMLSQMTARQLAAYRAHRVGMVFQTFNLISHLTAGQNVALGMLFCGIGPRERAARAAHMLARLGLDDRQNHRPHDLSGGEQQRVALARALVKRPRVLLADEPTGNLDQATSGQIAGLLAELHSDGLTIILVTHDLELAARHATRTLRMNYGRILNPPDAEARR